MVARVGRAAPVTRRCTRTAPPASTDPAAVRIRPTHHGNSRKGCGGLSGGTSTLERMCIRSDIDAELTLFVTCAGRSASKRGSADDG